MPARSLVQPASAKRHDGSTAVGSKSGDRPVRTTPEGGDVIVRREMREGRFVYVLCIASGSAQYLLRTREEAVAQAVAFATRQGVRAWLNHGTDDFVLLSATQVVESV